MKAAELTVAIPKIRVVDADTGRVYEGYYCEMPETTIHRNHRGEASDYIDKWGKLAHEDVNSPKFGY